MNSVLSLRPNLRTWLDYLKRLSEDYWSSILPNPDDEKIARVCKDFMDSDPNQRSLFSEMLDDNARSNLASFAFRMSMLAVRQQEVAKLTLALIALAAVDRFSDRHEFYGTLATLDYSAVQLGFEAKDLFENAAVYAVSATTAESLREFQRRKPSEKGLAAMMLRRIDGMHGVIYWNTISDNIPSGWL